MNISRNAYVGIVSLVVAIIGFFISSTFKNDNDVLRLIAAGAVTLGFGLLLAGIIVVQRKSRRDY